MELEAQALGYPGLEVTTVPPLRNRFGSLKRVAHAKLSGITMFSASFGGDRLLFSPWCTVLVDRGDRMDLLGVYRTDEGEPAEPGVPTACLRWSWWDQEADLEHVPELDELGTYLSFGPQVEHVFTFVDEHSHPGLGEVMDPALAVLTKGISVEPGRSDAVDWQEVDVEVYDDRLSCRFDYSPLTARCPVAESVLPGWIEAVAELAGRPGHEPDGTITVSIKRSVPELVSAPVRVPRRA